MGKRNVKNKGKSKQDRQGNIQAKINPVHIRISKEEAISYEKSILNAKEGIIRSVQMLMNYQKTREKELDKKAELRDLLKHSHVTIGRLIREDLPKIEELEEKRGEEVVQQKIEEVAAPEVSSLEMELREIQERLNSL